MQNNFQYNSRKKKLALQLKNGNVILYKIEPNFKELNVY